MDTSPPFSGNPTAGTWQGDLHRFSEYTWINELYANPVLISSRLSSKQFSQHPQIHGTFYPPAVWCRVMEKGTIWIECSGESTVSEIRNALKDADVTDIGFVTEADDSFVFYGILRALGPLSFTDMSINNYMGMIGGTSFVNQINYNRCNCQFLQVGHGTYWKAASNNSSFLFRNTGYGYFNNPYNYPIGNDNAINSIKGLASEGMGSNFSVNGMVVNCDGGNWRIDCRKISRNYINCVLNNAYLVLYYNYIDHGLHRIIDGLLIRSILDYDIQINYQNSHDYHIRNIDTLRPDNEKIIYNIYYSSPDTSVYFYRGGIITIFNEFGNKINNAIITIDNGLHQYSLMSNIVGEAVYEVLEQISLPPPAKGYFANTLYKDWIITISKDGYQTSVINYNAGNPFDIFIIFKKIIPIVYQDRSINSQLQLEENLLAEVSSDEITAELNNMINLNVNIEFETNLKTEV